MKGGILFVITREVLTNVLKFEQKSEWSERANRSDTLGKTIPGKGNSKHRVPDVGVVYIVCEE